MIGGTIVIGFGYKARRGKDTAANAIVMAFPDITKRYAFADPLGAEIEQAAHDQYIEDGMPLGDWTYVRGMVHLCAWAGVPFDPCDEKQRALRQWWGFEYRRTPETGYLVKLLARRIRHEQPEFAVISDVRLVNEFNLCDVNVRMDRPGFEIGDGRHHISERTLDAFPDSNWHAIITATSPEQVERQAVAFFAKIKAQRDRVRSQIRLEQVKYA